jgi:hypothetical protein
VTLISGSRVSLALEDVTKMATTVGADNLGALHTEGAVGVSGHSTRHSIEESRPAAARLELVVGLVERSLAASTGVNTLRGHVLVKVAAVGRLGALVTEDAELLYYRGVSQLSPCHLRSSITYQDSTEPAIPPCPSAMGSSYCLKMKRFQRKLRGKEC